jgi:Holliday junction DNA helicase RuvA
VLLEQGTSANPASNEAKMALESLGFKKEQIAKVLSNCSATDTAGLVKEALKQLQKL